MGDCWDMIGVLGSTTNNIEHRAPCSLVRHHQSPWNVHFGGYTHSETLMWMKDCYKPLQHAGYEVPILGHGDKLFVRFLLYVFRLERDASQFGAPNGNCPSIISNITIHRGCSRLKTSIYSRLPLPCLIARGYSPASHIKMGGQSTYEDRMIRKMHATIERGCL